MIIYRAPIKTAADAKVCDKIDFLGRGGLGNKVDILSYVNHSYEISSLIDFLK